MGGFTEKRDLNRKLSFLYFQGPQYPKVRAIGTKWEYWKSQSIRQQGEDPGEGLAAGSPRPEGWQ